MLEKSGEQVRGPHKPTLDEMGPHASLSVPKSSKAAPAKPARTIMSRPARLAGAATAALFFVFGRDVD